MCSNLISRSLKSLSSPKNNNTMKIGKWYNIYIDIKKNNIFRLKFKGRNNKSVSMFFFNN